jgi:uncharacterized protein YjbJ (UPF0337 family)
MASARQRNRAERSSPIDTRLKGKTMNWDQIKGNWKQFKGQAQQRWGKLTNDDMDVIDGQREELVGKLQERYGIAKEEAEDQIRDFESHCNC